MIPLLLYEMCKPTGENGFFVPFGAKAIKFAIFWRTEGNELLCQKKHFFNHIET